MITGLCWSGLVTTNTASLGTLSSAWFTIRKQGIPSGSFDHIAAVSLTSTVATTAARGCAFSSSAHSFPQNPIPTTIKSMGARLQVTGCKLQVDVLARRFVLVRLRDSLRSGNLTLWSANTANL